MSGSNDIKREQLRAVLVATGLGGKVSKSRHFSCAGLGSSSSSFGQMQFDVGANPDAQAFLLGHGFDDSDISKLKLYRGLSRKDRLLLDAKLQSIPPSKIDAFTNHQLDIAIQRVNAIVDEVRKRNSHTGDSIDADMKLKLGIADYANQFSSRHDDVLVDFLVGKVERGVKVGDPPTREDLQHFIDATPYGRNPSNKRAIRSREARFNMAMAELGLGPKVRVADHSSGRAGDVLRYGDHGAAVRDLQAVLSELGCTDDTGHLLLADGKFGVATRSAVEGFQRTRGLTIDGQVGPATWRAIDSEMSMLRRGTASLLPAVSAEPARMPDMDDPRNLFNPNHVLFSDLKYRFPEASDNRLLQFTAACHVHGITDHNLKDVVFDQQLGVVSFGGRQEGQPFRGVSVDVKMPSPQASQSIEQIRQHDQLQAQIRANAREPVAQTQSRLPSSQDIPPSSGGGGPASAA
ncbi:peptidoglycan-binding domain-containing protein [Dyella sp. A6]|uniref:peptidoglycan-binding domain-containing protein n=1 Tax=Dyella aluminiiresistens TaxID=3069105 RepID=UPI002E773AAB|nr:peptidoglycan-binding domain-containing protein [Dyella sp. A6]